MPKLRLGVQQKLLASAGLVLALMVAVGLVGVSALGSVDRKANDLNDHALQPIVHLGTAFASFNENRAFANQHMLETDRAKMRELEQKIQGNIELLDREMEAATKGVTGRQKAEVAEIERRLGVFRNTREQVLALSRQGRKQEAYALATERGIPQARAVAESFATLFRHEQEAGDAIAEEIASTYSSKRTLILVLLVLSVAIGLGVSWWIASRIKHGVATVLDRMQRLRDNCVAGLRGALTAVAQGDLTQTVEPTTPPITDAGADEIGDVARAFNDVHASTVASIEAYNDMVRTLGGMVQEIAGTSGTVASASQQMAATSEEAGRAVGEIAHAVQEVATGAERQVRSVEAAKRVTEDVAEATRSSAGSASEMASAASETRQVAHEGVEAVESATAAMEQVRASAAAATSAIRELGAKSGQISGIVETITGIAGQTNLLALNAAIEAARAGEQGRGFAVVAEEVRKLAEESQAAARSIADLVEEIQGETTKAVEVVESGAQQTEDGAAIVERARESFVRIGESVEDMNGRVDQIAAAIQQIASSSQQMQDDMAEVAAVAEQSSASSQQVSASTQQTSASTQQIAASAQSLAASAEQLERLVGRFTLSR